MTFSTTTSKKLRFFWAVQQGRLDLLGPKIGKRKIGVRTTLWFGLGNVQK